MKSECSTKQKPDQGPGGETDNTPTEQLKSYAREGCEDQARGNGAVIIKSKKLENSSPSQVRFSKTSSDLPEVGYLGWVGILPTLKPRIFYMQQVLCHLRVLQLPKISSKRLSGREQQVRQDWEGTQG